MARDPVKTRGAILDAAEDLILHHGFAGATVDAIIERAGVTKGAFFHHFASKSELGHEVVERFASRDEELFEEILERAAHLSSDPLQQVLITLGLYQELMDERTEPYLCLYASYCYQAQLFDDATLAVLRRAFAHTRARILAKLELAAERHPPRIPVDLESLADQVTVVFEGSFILAGTMDDPRAISKQVQHLRNYLELLFGDHPEPRPETTS